MTNKRQKKRIKWLAGMINAIHTVFFILLVFVIMRAVFCVDKGLNTGAFFLDLKTSIERAGSAEWFTFVGAFTIMLFGIVGVYEYCYLNNVTFLVPPAYIKRREKTLLNEAQKMMEVYYRNDIEFIKKYEDEQQWSLLQKLRLSQNQYKKVRYEILRIRAEKYTDYDTIQAGAKELFFHREYIENLEQLDSAKRLYNDVDYYLNLYSALYAKELCYEAGRLMFNFMCLELKEKLCDVDCIIVPQGSNVLLALEVGEQASIPVVTILSQERTTKGVFWDGPYEELRAKSLEKKVRIIVLHDVLVSGERIIESLEKLPKTSYELIGVFSIMYYDRGNNNAFKMFKRNRITKEKIHYIISASKNDLKNIYDDEKPIGV